MKNSIICPHCHNKIDLDEVYYKEIEAKHQNELKRQKEAFQKELEQKRNEYKKYIAALKQKEATLAKKEEEFSKRLENELQKRLITQKEKLHKQIKEQLQKEQEASIKLLQEELEQKSKKIQELNAAKIEIEKLKRQNQEIAMQAKLKAQKELNSKLEEEKKRLKELLLQEQQLQMKKIQDEQELKLKEKEEQLKQLQRALDEAKRKAAQQSMQLQGEALEITIEEYLKSKFPLDEIKEIKKGAFGADCIQIVNTREKLNCGIICYESKNTKEWSNNWIPKLKQDMQKVGANIGVLVTTAFPKGMNQMGFVDGIWVCSLNEFKAIVFLLRESLIKIDQAVTKEENKADKMQLLYDYLTGDEFAMQLRSIVDGFLAMKNELEKEKRSLMASWKRREKIIESVLENTTAMYGSLQGIAGSGAITPIKELELKEE